MSLSVFVCNTAESFCNAVLKVEAQYVGKYLPRTGSECSARVFHTNRTCIFPPRCKAPLSCKRHAYADHARFRRVCFCMVVLCLLGSKSSKHFKPTACRLLNLNVINKISGQKGGGIKCRALAQRLSQF